MTAARQNKPPAGPELYTPAEVAAVLKCSEWWVKEQARRRRVPYAWIAGSYRFTGEHLRAIVRVFEVAAAGPSVGEARPGATAERSTTGRGRRVRPAAPETPALVAKPPRRSRATNSDAA